MDLWATLSGDGWYWLLVLPGLSVLADFFILIICWVHPLFDPRRGATMKFQVGAMALGDLLTQAVLVFGLVLEKVNGNLPTEGQTYDTRPPKACQVFLYMSMVGQWCVWLFGAAVGVNTWLLLSHNIIWKERLVRFQHLAWPISFLIPIGAFKVQHFDPSMIFCYPDLKYSAGYSLLIYEECMFIALLAVVFVAYVAGFLRATKNSTEAVVVKQGERILWMLLMVGIVYSSYLINLPFVIQRKSPSKNMQVLWLFGTPFQGFANALLYVKLRWMPELKRRGDKLGDNRERRREHSSGAVAFESMDCVYVYGKFDPTNTRSGANDPTNTAVANNISGNDSVSEGLLQRAASPFVTDEDLECGSDENEGPYDDEEEEEDRRREKEREERRRATPKKAKKALPADRQCSLCQEWKTKEDYTPPQLRKGDGRRCRPCVSLLA
jgi:hypothetical protein